MECLNTKRGLSRYVEGAVTEQERHAIERHVAACAACAEAAGEYRLLRASTRALAAREPSDHLKMSLRVIASKERSRMGSRLTFGQRWNSFRETVSMQMNTIMRPLMLPAAGGLMSSVILFGLLVPDMNMALPIPRNDVPTVLFTDVSVKGTLPLSLDEHEIVLMLRVDEQGRMVDYRVVSGQCLLNDPSERRRLETTLLVTQFVPATSFGQPTSGQIRVSFRTNVIDVKG